MRTRTLTRAGKLALVHNGVIENYQTLKEQLVQRRAHLQSQTDTEVLAHLVGKHYDAARRRAVARRA